MTAFLWQQYGHDPQQQTLTALRTPQGSLSWQMLATEVDKLAEYFQQQGVSAGSGVGLYGKNSLQLVLAYLAVLQLQGRVLGINPAFSREKIQQICTDNHIAFLFSQEQGLIPMHAPQQVATALTALTMTLTSGSSGKAKAVVHNIAAHLANAQGVCELMHFDGKGTWLLSLPLYHVSGQGIIWRWLYAHGELMLPSDDFYADVLQSTHVSLVPTQLQRLLAYMAAKNISAWQTAHVLLGGTQIPTHLTQQLTQLGIQSYSGYGMTEMASTVCAKRSDHKTGVGQPLLGRELRLVNEEVWLRGAGLGLGYWQQGKILSLTNQEGWLQTKDKGQWIDGELVIIGRLDNQFISGGENIQPEEIERLLHTHNMVKEVFVLPVSDTEFGQRPVAMIQFSQDFSTPLVNELRRWLSDKIEKFKQPIAYYPLPEQAHQGIKISRAMLKNELNQWLKKSNDED